MTRGITKTITKLSVAVGLCCEAAVAATAFAAQPLRVGVFVDKASVAVDEVIRTLQDAGMKAEKMESKGSASAFALTNLCAFDVVLFGGGYLTSDWAGLDDRLRIAEYVEKRGGGVIFSMFRTGSPGRATQRPMFPEIADGYAKVNSPAIFVKETGHLIVAGLPREFMVPCWDHCILQAGPRGRVLALDANQRSVIVCGEPGGGRVVFLGPWIGLDINFKPMYPMAECDRLMLLNSVRWAAGTPGKTRAGGDQISDEIRLKVLRREKLLDWLHDERGKTIASGILTKARNLAEADVDFLLMRVRRLATYAGDAASSNSLAEVLGAATGLADQLHDASEKAMTGKRTEIERMSIEDLARDPIRDSRTWRTREVQQFADAQVARYRDLFLPPEELEAMRSKVEAIEALLAPQEAAAAAAAMTAVRSRDAEAFAGTIEKLVAPEASIRAAAALELGRMGNPASVPALIAALKDADYEVRRNAIFALGWMQSKEAVQPLIALAGSAKDIMTRRRAVQALGQIGDPAASDALLRSMKDPDGFIHQNAMLALGWLGEKKAVPLLLDVVRRFTDECKAAEELKQSGKKRAGPKKDVWANEEPLCAMRALGHIGDPAALEVLKPLTEAKTLVDRRDAFAMLSPAAAATYAVAEIEQGGRKEKGVRQMESMQDPRQFYWLTDQYNAFYGRYTSWGFYPTNYAVMGTYAADSGASGLIEFTTMEQAELRVPGQDQYLAWFSRLGLKTMNGVHTEGNTLFDKAGFEADLFRWGANPCVGGFWGEEALHSEGYFKSAEDRDTAFRAHLAAKYDAKALKALGLPELKAVTCPAWDERNWYYLDGARSNKVLFAEYNEYVADRTVDFWQETAEWLTGLRKGTYLTFSLSQRYHRGGSTYISAYPRLCAILAQAGPQSYCEHAWQNNFHLDLHVDGESRPALGEFYHMDADTPRRVECGLASSFVHGQSFFVWWWGQIFKHCNDANGGPSRWDKGRWEACERQFRKGRAISEYVAPARTAGPKLVAQLYSGRTTSLTYGRDQMDGFGGSSHGGRFFRYTQHQVALWESLMQSHLPVDMTWVETQSPAKLGRYKVAVLADAWSLSAREIEMIREWVRAGGVLIATGGTSRHDQWDRPLPNYALADVFGVDFVRGELRGSEAVMHEYLELHLAPTSGVETIAVGSGSLLKHMEGAKAVAQVRALGCDIVKPGTAAVLAAWPDGMPAVTENSFGKGGCIFISPVWPALNCVTRKWTVEDLYKDFGPGVRELLAGCVRRGLEFTGTELPVEAVGLDKRVELVLKTQEEHNRWMVHLLAVDPDVATNESRELCVRVPEGRTVAGVYYVYPERKRAEYSQEGGVLSVKTRAFDIHDMLVIEFGERE